MFGRRRESAGQHSGQRNRTEEAEQALTTARKGLKDAYRYAVITGDTEGAERRINEFAAKGWTIVSMSTSPHDGLQRITVVMENSEWNREALESAKRSVEERQSELDALNSQA